MKMGRDTILILCVIFLMGTIGACGGGGSDKSDNGNGNASINLRGGTTAGGTSTQGGDGDTSTIQSDGDVILARAGTVDASFPDPVYTADLGANGYTVSADITVPMDEDLVVGGLYVKSTLMSSSVRIYEGNGDNDSGNDPAVTGIYVAAGATLTLPAASDTGGTPKAWYLLDNDLIVQGTVTTADDSTYLSFEIDAGNEANIVVETDGLITTVPEEAGADGGRVYLITDGSIIINGDVLMSGTAPGGNAGFDNTFEAYNGDVYVTGSMRADGADDLAGTGGGAGEIYLYSYVGGIFIDGIITSDGGDGGDGDGGDGGYVYAIAGYEGGVGDLLVQGNLSCSGGDAVGGAGGNANYVDLENQNNSGDVKINATLYSRGGDGSGTGSSGGDGYNAYFYNDSGGIIQISGSMDLSGGDGAVSGGQGGYFEIYQSSGQPAKVELLGISDIDLTGGYGESGGFGGSLDFWAEGKVTCDSDLTTDGGNGEVTGGDGGDISIGSGNPPSVVSGTTSISGGTGGTADGLDGVLSLDIT